jgi:hypothetical protein
VFSPIFWIPVRYHSIAIVPRRATPELTRTEP